MRFRYEVSHVLVGKVLSIIVMIFSSIYFARMLQAEGRGELSVITSISGTFLQLCNFGLHSAHIYYVSKDKTKMSVVEGNIYISFLISIGIATISYPVMIAFPDILKISPHLLVLALCLFVTNLFLMLQENLFLAIGNIAKYNLLQIMSPALTLGIAIIASFWLHVDVYLIALLSVAAQSITILISFADKMLVKPTMSLKYYLSVLPYGMKSYISCLVSYLLLRADIFMLNYFLPKSEVGYYALAVNFTDALYMVSSSVSTVLFPKLSSFATLEQKEDLMYKVLKFIIPIILILSGLVGVFAEHAVHILFGDGFMNSVSLIRGLLIASIAWGIGGIAFSFFASENRFMETIVIPLIAFFVNIGMNYLLIPRLSTFGAVVASDVSYVFVAFMMYICMHIYIKRHRIVESNNENLDSRGGEKR